jgi:predicted deacylase
MTADLPPFEVLPRDLQPYRRGNVGVDHVHRFESGKPGPHVLVNALTHGNEFCGMVAATHLLDTDVRPKIGTLTVSFANVAAYESFDTARPFDSRQLVHNLNRIWSAPQLDGDEDSPELRRARELRPVVAAADHILDIHSTSQDVSPFWVYPKFERNAAAALAIGRPAVHMVMPQGLGSGTPLIQHGRHGSADHHGVAMVAECGQHFKQASADLATEVALDFLAHFGLIDPRPKAAAAAAALRAAADLGHQDRGLPLRAAADRLRVLRRRRTDRHRRPRRDPRAVRRLHGADAGAAADRRPRRPVPDPAPVMPGAATPDARDVAGFSLASPPAWLRRPALPLVPRAAHPQPGACAGAGQRAADALRRRAGGLPQPRRQLRQAA